MSEWGRLLPPGNTPEKCGVLCLAVPDTGGELRFLRNIGIRVGSIPTRSISLVCEFSTEATIV